VYRLAQARGVAGEEREVSIEDLGFNGTFVNRKRSIPQPASRAATKCKSAGTD
jgi:hypothetical protein